MLFIVFFGLIVTTPAHVSNSQDTTDLEKKVEAIKDPAAPLIKETLDSNAAKDDRLHNKYLPAIDKAITKVKSGNSGTMQREISRLERTVRAYKALYGALPESVLKDLNIEEIRLNQDTLKKNVEIILVAPKSQKKSLFQRISPRNWGKK